MEPFSEASLDSLMQDTGEHLLHRPEDHLHSSGPDRQGGSEDFCWLMLFPNSCFPLSEQLDLSKLMLFWPSIKHIFSVPHFARKRGKAQVNKLRSGVYYFNHFFSGYQGGGKIPPYFTKPLLNKMLSYLLDHGLHSLPRSDIISTL